MAKPLTVFRGSAGLNNKVDPVNLHYDPDTGVSELAVAYNVDIDRRGRIARRKGFRKVHAAAVHSLFCDGGHCLFVSGDALKRLNPDYTATALRAVTPGARMRYVQVDGDIYYANGFEKGVVRADGLSYEWTGGAYVGPPTTKTFEDPPIGHLLEHFNGRIYIANGCTVWYSEPFAYAWFNTAENFIPLASRVRMIRAVRGGLFVSSSEKTFFFAGSGPKEFSPTVVADYPAIEGADVIVEGSRVASGEIVGRAAMWASPRGVCIGGPDGTFRNLTERKLEYPSANVGAAYYRDGVYLCSLIP